MNTDANPRTILTALAAGLSAASLALSGYHLLTRNRDARQRASPQAASAAAQRSFPETRGDVAKWLASTAASPQTVQAFVRSGVDGDALAVLTVPDLIAMGIPAKERSVVMAALAMLDEAAYTPAVPAPHPRVRRPSPPLTPHPSHPSRAPASESHMPSVNAFLADADGIFTDLIRPSPTGLHRRGGGDDDDEEDNEEEDGMTDPQQGHALMATRLFDLLDVFHGLSAAEQHEAMLPLARRLNAALTRPAPRAVVVRPTAAQRLAERAEHPPSPAVDFEGKMRPLHDMVDSFVQLLRSPDLDGVPVTELEPLAARIAAQIERVADVARRVPPQLGVPLQAKCKLVTDLLRQRLTSSKSQRRAPNAGAAPTSSRAPTAPPTREAAPSVADLMARLRSVFLRTRDSALLEMESEKRLVAVDEMVMEVEAIQRALAAVAPSEQTKAGIEVSENVLALLQKLRALTLDEARLAKATGEEDSAAEAANVGGDEGDDADSDPEAQFASVASVFLDRIVSLLQSANFTAASPADKRAILSELMSRVDALGKEAEELPEAQRLSAMRVIEQARRLLRESGADLEEAEQPQGDAEESEEDGGGADTGEDADEEDDGAGMPRVVPPAESLDDAVTQMENIFRLLNSERFTAAPVPEKRLIASELLKRVQALKGPILRALRNDATHPVMVELVEPLEDLLENMAHSTGPSQQFSDIVDVLKDMDEVLSSNALSESPPERQMSIVKATIEQLQRITSTFSSLPPSERVAAEKLVAPVNAKLSAFIKGAEGSARGRPPQAGKATQESDAAARIIAELQTITGALRTPDFLAAPPEERAALMNTNLTKLRDLLARCASLPPAHRDKLAPFVADILSRLQALAEATQTAPTGGTTGDTGKTQMKPTAAAAATPTPRAEDEQRSNMFASLRDIANELERGNRRGIKLSENEALPLRQLHAMVSSVDNLTNEEKELCEAFAAELEEASEPTGAEGNGDEDAGEGNAATKHVDAASGEDGEGDDDGEDGEDGEKGESDMEAFLSVFKSIQKTLDAERFPSLSALLPIMSVVENTLTTADERGIPWQSDMRAVAVVSDVLAKIQSAQAELRTAASAAPSSSVAALTRATTQLKADPPQTRADLTPYMELLKEHMNAATFTREEMTAMEALKDAIASAARRLKEESENRSDDAEEKEAEERRAREDHLAEALLAISGRLRDADVSNEELDKCEAVVDQLADAAVGTSDEFTELIDSVRAYIRHRRIANASEGDAADDDDDADDDVDADERSSPEEDKKAATSAETANEAPAVVVDEEDDADSSSVAVDAPAVDAPAISPDWLGLAEKVVVGGAENEVTLLPKIEQRIGLPTEEFTVSCSLFDIQNISKVLLHLSTDNSPVKRDRALRQRVDEAKAKFVTQLAAFRSADNASAQAQSSTLLKVTGEEKEGGDNNDARTHDLVVFTSEESDQYQVNESLMSYLQEPKNVVSPTIKSAVAEGWKGTSKALLVYAFSGAPEDETEHSTALAELVLLHEVLEKRYGFDVTAITDPRLNAESALQLVKNVAATAKGRLLVYFCTPPSRNAVAVPQAVTFHDDSVLEYGQVLTATRDSVERAVVVHNLPRKLEMICRLKEKVSPAMSVRLTSKAAKEVAKLRCWLYDGIFTPVVVELLCRDEGTMLCPEDLIHYAVTATTRMTLEFGSFTDSEPASMAYFLPLDVAKTATY